MTLGFRVNAKFGSNLVLVRTPLVPKVQRKLTKIPRWRWGWYKGGLVGHQNVGHRPAYVICFICIAKAKWLLMTMIVSWRQRPRPARSPLARTRLIDSGSIPTTALLPSHGPSVASLSSLLPSVLLQ